jgi:hypothetical protein
MPVGGISSGIPVTGAQQMRLTLRTLLAWLDGVLPDEEQQQLGAKVSSSAVATQLVERIRSAVGRTAIGAPKPDGRGLTEDPNSVAEYLDNTLSSDQLEAFERICIESEIHLAEVAACHGLLAEVARDPSVEHALQERERQRIRERMRGLLAGIQDREATEHAAAARDGDGHAESRETARDLRNAINDAINSAATPDAAAAAVGTQAALPRPVARRSSLAAWAAALTAVALLLTLVGVLTWSLLRGGNAGRGNRRPQEVAVVQEEPQAVEPPPVGPAAAEATAPPQEPPADKPPADKPPGAGGGSRPEAEPVADGTPPTEAVAAPQGSPLAPAVPMAAVAAVAAAPEAASSPALPQAVASAPTGEAGPNPKPGPEPEPAAQPAAQPAAEPAAQPERAIGVVGAEGVLLRMTEAAGAVTWSHFPGGSPLQSREDLLVPPAFQPELHVGGVTIRLFPETRAALSVDADGTPRIEVVFGRAVARASQADARLGMTAAGLVGIVDAGLLSPVAIEVKLDRLPGREPANTLPRVEATVIASRGLAWRQTASDGRPAEQLLEGIDAKGMLEAGMSLAWGSTEPGRVKVVRSRVLPTWIESGSRPDRLEKAASEALAAKVTTTTPLTRALREMASDKRVENRMLAASTLALLGEFNDLVEQLATESDGRTLEPRQWSQLESTAVPLALARGGNAASRLQESFANRGPHGKAEVLWAMARGFTDEELAAGADRGIVAALEDPSLIVRRYASKSLIDITQPNAVDRNRYRPEVTPDRRRDGVLWWRGQLEKGLIRRGAALARDIGRPTAGPAKDPEADPDADGDAEPDTD